MFIGIDDTDSRKGMCTTYLALELVKEFEGDLELIGHPRLVRLNPNIPWKTRGNGAVCVRLGPGKGRPKVVGELDGRPVMMWPFEERSGRASGRRPLSRQAAMDRVKGIIERWAHLDEEGTDSGIYVSDRRPPRALYWRAVREVVPIKDALHLLPKDSLHKTYNTNRGIVGASACVAWAPGDRTYEVLAYRERPRWGSRREVNINDVKLLDARFPSTFNNYDAANGHAPVVPATPCPILFGIRGEDPDILPDAMRTIRSEPKDRWVVFETNQGTDDHMVKRSAIARYQSGILKGSVVGAPHDIPGGHVLFELRIGRDGPIYTCSAYEPTKEFRRVVRALVPGDVIMAYGSRTSSNPNTVNIEKLRVDRPMTVTMKVGNPKCPACGRSMKSIGKAAGYRCKRCGVKATGAKPERVKVTRPIGKGFYEVPVCARRHLHKPLYRMGISASRPPAPSATP